MMSISRPVPLLDSSIKEKIKWIESLKYTDFTIHDYQSAGSIKALIK
jgi:thymidylate synthase